MKKQLLLFILALSFFTNSNAQINLDCEDADMNAIYLVASSGIYRIDSVDSNPTNPVLVMPNSQNCIGISINDNLDSIGGGITMYCSTNFYYYWNGSGWTATGNLTGNSGAVNPGGSSDFIFNITDAGSQVFRYDGTTTGQLVLTISNPSSGFVHDVAVDQAGNFYLFYTNAEEIVAYTSNGIPIDTFATTGFAQGSQCGLAILGDRVYANSCGSVFELYEGIKTGNTINFSVIKSIGFHSSDIAACPYNAQPLAVFEHPDLPHIAVYPNPAYDKAAIKLRNTTVLEVFDSLGKLISRIETKGLDEYILDVSAFTSGMYFLRAESSRNTFNYDKLIVR